MNEKVNIEEARSSPLGLKSVLVGSLPGTLLTDEQPILYAVEAVFTRRPEQVEVDAIQSEGAHRFLRERGYEAVALEVSDRRLRILNTSLEQLRDGLASTLAEYLVLTGAAARTERQAAEALNLVVAEREHERAEAVAALAESVEFTVPTGLLAEAAASSDSGEGGDVVHLADWADDGASRGN